MTRSQLKEFLDEKAELYQCTSFIENDPISVPHTFSSAGDIEVSAFLVATISWGNRKSIITNANRMMSLMDGSPYEFVTEHHPSDLKRLSSFVHRTFNGDDFIQFVKSLQNIYVKHEGLQRVFTNGFENSGNAGSAIAYFKKVFEENYISFRTTKHISDPESGSAAKRLNMFLRWMVRKNSKGVDFGIWESIPTAQLSIPLDVHTGNVSRKLNLLTRKQNDWKAVSELDIALREFDAVDPIKYDFALFGLGAMEKF
jgi:uncharacterized protein (TIGR02757 family)